MMATVVLEEPVRVPTDYVVVDWRDPYGVKNGEQIEVVGFVGRGHTTYAVWRDDDGRLYDIPAHLLRMEPRVKEQAEDVA